MVDANRPLKAYPNKRNNGSSRRRVIIPIGFVNNLDGVVGGGGGGWGAVGLKGEESSE